MNKNIVCLIIFIFSSCINKDIDCSKPYILKNKTEKRVLLSVEQIAPSDSLVLGTSSSDTAGIIKYWTSHNNCTHTKYSETLYCIDDTMSLDIQNEQIQWMWHSCSQCDNNSPDRNAFYIDDSKNPQLLILTVTDTLLTIFKKDYTMLEKFKEYYQK